MTLKKWGETLTNVTVFIEGKDNRIHKDNYPSNFTSNSNFT